MTEENDKEIEAAEEVKTEKIELTDTGDTVAEGDTSLQDEEENDDEENEFSDDEDHAVQADTHDLEKLTVDQLYDKAKECLMHSPREALNKLKTIRPVFFEKYQELKKEELEKLDEAEIDNFNFDKAPLAEGFNQLLATAKAAIAEERKRIEEEKQNNYKHKLKLLATLDDLVSEDETEQSIARVKEIQKEWRQIKVVPKDKIQELWDKFHMLLDKFYDNHSINIELKELDRKKNLEAKIELTKKVEEIANEPSLKRSFILLNKYHEEFRNIGPVPRESRDGIWQTFKAASDHIYSIKKEQHEAQEAVREENLKLKELLVEKSNVIAQIEYDNIKDWNSKTKELEKIFADWKKIGPVPRSKSDAIWAKFKKERNQFYANRKQYFSALNKDRKINLKLKETLCERVEALKDNDDFNNTTKEILTIQKEWKSIGPVPDKLNQTIWNRFRKACDYFFNRKEQRYASQREAENKNLEEKKNLLKELELLSKSSEDEKSIFNQLKEISSKWNKIGHIPRSEIKKVSGRYEKLSDDLFKKYKKNKDELKSSQWESYYTDIIGSPNGLKRIKDEEFKLKKKLKFLQEELLNTERNMSFFNLSKGAGSLLKDFEKKQDKSQNQVERIKKELKVIQKVKRNSVASTKNEQDDTV